MLRGSLNILSTRSRWRGSLKSVLGISAFYHDSAAALVVDGQIVAAAQEERFTRIKHDASFPRNAINYCLKEVGLTSAEVDYVGFYEKPLLKFDRLLETYLAVAPRGFRSFTRSMPIWLKQKLLMGRTMRRALDRPHKRMVFCEHHESHAASAFFPSPFDEAAIITLDGVGEWATATWGVGHGNRLDLKQEIRFPHSLGLLYSAFTYYAGFRVNSGEYKLMGLAPYGEPVYAEMILSKLMDLKEDGSFRLDLSYFNYCQGLTMTSTKLDRLLGRKPRQSEGPLTQDDMDLAASIQQVTEEVMLRTARHVHRQTGLENLCMAGGVALNCVGNGRILRESPIENLWIQPAAGDAGGALGVALFTWHQLMGEPRTPVSPDAQRATRLGPRVSENEARTAIESANLVYHHVESESNLCDRVASYIAAGKVVGWVNDRMEFGPRALGSRSILGDPRSEKMQSLMNQKIKFRESFRPFAPSILRERVHDYFETRTHEDSPYMNLVALVCPTRRRTATQGLTGLQKLGDNLSDLPATTHVDYTSRLQTVDAERHGRYYKMLKSFEKLTACPVLINTSFNVRGEPIVCTAEDAVRCFLATEMDVLVLEDFLLLKDEQPQQDQARSQTHLAQFKLD